jgi:hypothetical protein
LLIFGGCVCATWHASTNSSSGILAEWTEALADVRDGETVLVPTGGLQRLLAALRLHCLILGRP